MIRPILAVRAEAYGVPSGSHFCEMAGSERAEATVTAIAFGYAECSLPRYPHF
jgi:hypothetical protein